MLLPKEPKQPEQPQRPEPEQPALPLSDSDSGAAGGGTPSRGRLRSAALFGGLAVAGLLVGIVTGRLTGTGSANVATLRPSQVMATSVPTTAVTTPPPPSPTPSPTPTTPKPSPSTTRAAPPDYRPIPADATAEKGLDFGFLTAVTKNGDLLTISFDRAAYYTGALATAHNGGTVPANDYLIENTNSFIRVFTVAAPSPLIGVSRLAVTTGGPIQQQPLDAATFVANATKALSSGLGVPVWLRHTQGENGPVTSLAEQYIP